MLYGYLAWWYNEGLTELWQLSLAVIHYLTNLFSLKALVKTWLAPWKNDVTVATNPSLGTQVNLWEQNLVSRLVGFTVRSVVIAVSLILLLLATATEAIVLSIWVIGPFLILTLPIAALWLSQ